MILRILGPWNLTVSKQANDIYIFSQKVRLNISYVVSKKIELTFVN